MNNPTSPRDSNTDGGPPTCHGISRPDLANDAYNLVREIAAVLNAALRTIEVPESTIDERTAILTYLAYTGVMVNVVLADILVSAVHGNDLSIVMKSRVLLEYTMKAQYFSERPEYALYEMTIHELEDVIGKFERSGMKNNVAAKQKELAIEKKRFPRAAKQIHKRFGKIMTELGAGEEYAWFYGAPSALLHGDPEGMRTAFKIADQIYREPRYKFENGEINAWVAEAAKNSAAFLRMFVNWYHPNDSAFSGKIDELDARTQEIVSRYPLGRDREQLAAIKSHFENIARPEPPKIS